MYKLKQFIRNYKSEIAGWVLVIITAIIVYQLGNKVMKDAILMSFFFFLPIWIYKELKPKRKAENSNTK